MRRASVPNCQRTCDDAGDNAESNTSDGEFHVGVWKSNLGLTTPSVLSLYTHSKLR